MQSKATETVRSVNALTADWARIAVREGDRPGQGTVFSAAGVWPLLALLAGGAHGPARGELHGALGIADAHSATALGRQVIEALQAMDGVDAATGLWTRAELPVRPVWRSWLPDGVHGTLTGDAERDRAELDAWAARHTQGRITTMPVPLRPDLMLVLAGALLIRTTWTTPFNEGWLMPRHGAWEGRRLGGLFRSTGELDQVRLAPHTPAGPLTLAEVRGDNGLDVHLLLGDEGVPGGKVLEAGVAVLDGDHATLPGSALDYGTPGPGLTVADVIGWDERPKLNVATPAFTVRAEHDLLQNAGLFGLLTAVDGSQGHFPGISTVPLAISSGRQSMTAGFSAKGFEAAAVTAFALAAAGVPQRRSKQVGACFDRPFGFLAVHRASGLVLAAGWVTDPDEAPDPSGPGLGPGLGW
ncbi:serpin family protein [Streptomyces sp. NPDC053048]|uniref:serpin family protein n=1 Tax=Streptomyces sp. NPDC053048 TaxID=3365694 RepID=UPI0037D89C07